ncbi:hypothetical protein D8674_028995 [Pyrus ussuriensis x Pyrus communis]|uniref:DUF4378 domain-containing protein n=1 Tax=Pyrus ussuriensis x Pyrus communis TaxID=2448454 RepID=A0A5N5HYS7_9ROSA|nr:hypothetical protein D8674_028995 [Pyrus ussuriensis x Pyrus communis]
MARMTSPRSPMPRSPMPKSPMPKSPMVCEKYETGCMWHLYGLFNFRQGHSNKKLLSHRRHLKRIDDGNLRTKLDLPNKIDEKCENMDDGMKNKTQTVDSDMASKRKLKGEELSTELLLNKNIAADEVKHLQSDSKFVGPLPKNNGKTSNNRQRSHDIPLHGLKNDTKHRKPSNSTSAEKPLNKLSSAALPEVLSKEVHRKKRRGCGCKSIDYVKYGQINENNHLPVQMNAADAIISQKFIDGVNHQSKQLSDALQILNSNKELFVELLQDPNSLIVKHIEDPRESQTRKHQSKSVCEENISECRTSKARQSKGPPGIHNLNSSDFHLSQESSDSEFAERIVVLTAGPPRLQNSSDGIYSCSSMQSYYSFNKDGESERPANFSLSRMKRKLRRAIGVSSKEQDSKTINGTLQISPCQGSEDSKGKGVKIMRRNSPSTNNSADSGVVSKSSFDIENRNNIGKVNECESSIGCATASTSGTGLQNPNISLVSQPKKKTFAQSLEHLSELLLKGNKDKNNFVRRTPKTCEGVASFPEDDFLPTRSPERDWENTFVDEPMRFSPYSNYQLVYENKSRLQKEKKTCYLTPLRQDVEAMPENKKLDDQLQVLDILQNIDIKGLGDNSRPKGCVQILENNSTMHRGETNSLELPSESDSTDKVTTIEVKDTIHSGETSSLEVLSKPESTEKTNTIETSDATYQGETNHFEDQPLTSSPDVFSSTPSIQRVEDSDNIKGKREQPSPVSVLEQYFVDATSPASTIFEPAEEHHSHSLTRSHLDPETSSLREHQVISEYIKAVLQASTSNWNELSLMPHSSDQLLDPFLFDAVKLQANQFNSDWMLFFDCINEVLDGVYHTHLPCSPWVSFIKPIASRQFSENAVIHEVMKSVDWYLLPHSLPQTLQQIVEKDIACSGAWLDLRNDSEEVIFKMVEGVLEELIMETIF